ncbi:MAG: formyltetrahydrofolate deformylase [bacterium]
MNSKKFVLKMRCLDRPGIIAALTPIIEQEGGDIREANVYGDPQTEEFFVRIVLRVAGKGASALKAALQPTVDRLATEWSLHDLADKIRVLIAVSKFDHCLNDILHKWQIGSLPVEMVGVVSNHETLRQNVERHHLPFHFLPISPVTKSQQEQQFSQVITESNADLVVLARYMQILSDEFSARLAGKCINIHHSFLPSFKGARPYHQAHQRGVKLIGATAHFVTADLDEGPIIEQDVRRVTHATTPADMIAIGREVESSVLSRAIKWQAEHRIFRNGHKTVILT